MVKFKANLADIGRSVATSHSRKGYLRLDMNESVDGLPAQFVRSVLDGIGPEELASYPEYDLLVNRLAELEGLDASMILPTNGSDAAIKYLYEAFVSPGDTVALTDPTFAMYTVYARIYQATVRAAAYGEDFAFPETAFSESLSGAVMAAVVNPNNPTGTLATPEALERLAKRCGETDTLFVVDEAYIHYHGNSAASLLRRYPNMAVLRTFSKAFGLANLRLGILLAAPAVVEAVLKVKPTFDANGLAVRLGLGLLNTPGILNSRLRLVEEGRSWLKARLTERGIPFRDSQANFLLINLGENVATVKTALSREGVLVAGGFSQACLRPYLRVTLGGPEIMAKFWQAFERTLDT